MRIAILGAGAMGSLFGAYLSQHNEVWLVDTDQRKVDAIRKRGVAIQEPDGEHVFHLKALADAENLGPVDMVIVFVKAMHSREALEKNRSLIGKKTYLLSLQNGLGHENVLTQFVSLDRAILGTTQHNSSLRMPGVVHHGGSGKTSIGMPGTDSAVLEAVAAQFSECGFETEVSNDIRRQIWSKLFLNTSASALTAILQVKLGYIAENSYAWLMASRLIYEAVAVANADKMDFDPDKVTAGIREILLNARDAHTSIYTDVRDGMRTEVDSISGSVVRKAKQLGISVPAHEFVVNCIHAMETRSRN